MEVPNPGVSTPGVSTPGVPTQGIKLTFIVTGIIHGKQHCTRRSNSSKNQEVNECSFTTKPNKKRNNIYLHVTVIYASCLLGLYFSIYIAKS